MSRKKKLRIGIVGCGAIGGSLAREIVSSFSKDAVLSALYDIRGEKGLSLARKVGKSAELCTGNLDALIKRSELVIEASSARAAWNIARRSLSAGRDIMVMSVGGMVGHLEGLDSLAAAKKARVYFPSGAISGVDALKAANIGRVKEVILTTRKNPAAFNGVEYVTERFRLKGLKKDKILFSGSASEAVRHFPQNINVAAVLGLAGIGMRKTQVRIIASPSVKRNIHEVAIVSDAARVFTRTENVLHPQNPKTSYLAVLAAVATLRQILKPIKIGT